MLKKKRKRKKNIKLANTSGYMIYGIFKCYDFHFNNYVGFSIIIKNEENRASFSIGETICLECAAQQFILRMKYHRLLDYQI